MNEKNQKSIELQLKLLSSIEKNDKISQRYISKDLNVALGLANALIKKFVKKGFLKLSEAPVKRYLYYITPKGLIEKTNLTRQYLKNSLDFYKKAKDDYENIFIQIKYLKINKIILAGSGELAEIAILASNIQNVRIKFIYDNNTTEGIFCGIPVKKIIPKKLQNKDTIFVLTEAKKINEVYHKINKKYKILKPNFLDI